MRVPVDSLENGTFEHILICVYNLKSLKKQWEQQKKKYVFKIYIILGEEKKDSIKP